jgi:hypothetical protein
MKPGSKSGLLDRTAKAKADLQDMRTTLKGLADEIRVQVHLGTMDLKDRWKALEPKLSDAERYVDEVSDSSRVAMGDLVKRFREMRDHLAQIRASHAVARR